jgi:hypothetical protein
MAPVFSVTCKICVTTTAGLYRMEDMYVPSLGRTGKNTKRGRRKRGKCRRKEKIKGKWKL